MCYINKLALPCLMKWPFRIITSKQILSQYTQGTGSFRWNWKTPSFIPRCDHRRFLRFAFEGVSYQYTVLPFGLSLAPRTFTKCMGAALSPLRQLGIRILNNLDDWLILAQLEDELLYHRSVLLSHLECLGFRVNFAKSALSHTQRISFLGTVIDVVTPERTLAIQQLAASFKLGVPRPFKAYQCMLVLMALASSVLQLGLLHMWPLQYWLKPWVPPHAWRHGRLRIIVSQACIAALAPWNDRQWMEQGVPLGMVCRRKVVSTDASSLGKCEEGRLPSH